MVRQRRIRKLYYLPGYVLIPLLLLAGFAACGTSSTTLSSQVRTAGRSNAIPAQRTLTYVAIGASDAFGIGTSDPDRQSWPSVLSTKLGQRVHLVNLGIPGETMGDALKDELPIAVDSHPDIVTVWLGVNDINDHVSLSQYRSELTSLLSTLRGRTHARVFVANIPDLSELPFFAKMNRATLLTQISEWNTAITSAVKSESAVLVDLTPYGSQLANHPEYLASDGLHPSAIGAQHIAAVFAQTIRSAGGA